MKLVPQTSVLLLAACLAASPAAVAAGSTNTAETAKPAPKISDLFADEVVAQGKDVKVLRSTLDDELVNIKASAAARGQPIPPARLRLLEAQVLENIIGRQLLAKRATDADKTAGAESAAKKLDTIKKNSGGDEAFTRQLRTVGMTLEQLTSKLNEEEAAEAVLQREIKVEVTDDDVKKFYDENPTQFEQPELAHPAHILISTREKDGSEMSDEKKKTQRKLAEDILKRAKAGEDFAKLAKDFSDDPMSKDKGGDTGSFPRGLPQVPPEFEARAFSLEPNQIGDIVTTQGGYHIIKLLEKKPAKKLELAEVAADVKKGLRRQGILKKLPDYMEGVMKEAGVEILDKELKKFIEEQRAAEKEAMKRAEAREAEETKAPAKK